MTLRQLVAVGGAAGLLAACGTTSSDDAGSPERGDQPTTARALAAVAAELAPGAEKAEPETDAAEEFDPGAVGTQLDYGSSDAAQSRVTLAVGEGLDPDLPDCERGDKAALGCVETERGTLLWEREAPEEDPGVVYVVVPKGKSSVLMFESGPRITGDPRSLDLPVPVDTLFEIAHDPRVDVTTSQAALDAGEDLEIWSDGD